MNSAYQYTMGSTSDTTADIPKSHVHGLLQSVAASPSRIAPERVEEYKMLVQKHDIELLISDFGETSFDMGTMFGKILIPMRVHHHLWSAALLFAALYIERDLAMAQGKREVDLRHPDIDLVSMNYQISCTCFLEDRELPIPLNAKEITSRDDYIALADELFLSMVAFCILHEVAHIEKGDSKTDDEGRSLNQEDPHEIEFAADQWAYHWVLEKWNVYSSNPKVFIKRTLGVIFSLALMEEFRHHQKGSFGSSHPEACDRLLRFFQDYKAEIAKNEYRATCLTATYIGLQVAAWANDYLFPTEGYSDPIGFLRIVKEDGPKLLAEVAARKAANKTKRASTMVGGETESPSAAT